MGEEVTVNLVLIPIAILDMLKLQPIWAKKLKRAKFSVRYMSQLNGK